jgi:hypothetical protein
VFLVNVGAQVPEPYAGGFALRLPTAEPGATSTHAAGMSADTAADPSGWEQAVSSYAVTVVVHVSPAGEPQKQVHTSEMS